MLIVRRHRSRPRRVGVSRRCLGTHLPLPPSRPPTRDGPALTLALGTQSGPQRSPARRRSFPQLPHSTCDPPIHVLRRASYHKTYDGGPAFWRRAQMSQCAGRVEAYSLASKRLQRAPCLFRANLNARVPIINTARVDPNTRRAIIRASRRVAGVRLAPGRQREVTGRVGVMVSDQAGKQRHGRLHATACP